MKSLEQNQTVKFKVGRLMRRAVDEEQLEVAIAASLGMGEMSND